MILMEIKDFMFFNGWLTRVYFAISCLPACPAMLHKYVTKFLHFLMTACYIRAVCMFFLWDAVAVVS